MFLMYNQPDRNIHVLLISLCLIIAIEKIINIFYDFSMNFLAIETSCDETSCAIVDNHGHILAHIIRSQIDDHKKYAGVVPELAARKHLEICDYLVMNALQDAHCDKNDITAICATAGPGLIGSLLIGLMVGQAFSHAWKKPFYAINHIEAHALSPTLNETIVFPYLLLLVSGGHSEFIYVDDVGRYYQLGKTIDDAAGEAFDKAAKLLKLPYPGGPHIEQAAKNGNPNAYQLARPMIYKQGCDLSFSGLKSDLRRHILQHQQPLSDMMRDDFAASFQQAITDTIIARCKNALTMTPTPVKQIVVAGGVGANNYIKNGLIELCYRNNLTFYAPPPILCTDNAAMIAWAAHMRFKKNLPLGFHHARPRWPLEEMNNI